MIITQMISFKKPFLVGLETFLVWNKTAVTLKCQLVLLLHDRPFYYQIMPLQKPYSVSSHFHSTCHTASLQRNVLFLFCAHMSKTVDLTPAKNCQTQLQAPTR